MPFKKVNYNPVPTLMVAVGRTFIEAHAVKLSVMHKSANTVSLFM